MSAAQAEDRAAVQLRPDVAELRLSERALAVTRALLAIAAVFVGYLTPPSTRTEWAQLLLVFYAVYAVVLLLVVIGTTYVTARFQQIVQAVDVGYVGALAMVPIGDTVPFFSFLLFPLFTAGARWGFNEVMVTTLLIEGVIGIDKMFDPTLRQTTFLPRAIAIAAAGAAIGYVAEQQRRLRFEDRAIAVVLGRARLGGTLGDTVNLALASVRNAFSARQVLVVFVEQPSRTRRVLLWGANVADPDALDARPLQLPPSRHDDYLFDAPGAAWHAWTNPFSRSRGFRVVALDPLGRRVPAATFAVPAGFLADHPCRRLIGASLQLSDEWVCRLMVLDPQIGVHPEQSARFALQLAQKVGPALYNQYLVSRLRTRAQAVERSRIAREMHDGVTQSLLGLEMEIAVLRRRAKAEAPPLVEDLARVHGIVRDEVVTVRELMEGIRVDDVGSGDLVHHLSDVVDRFSRYTGIAARFVSDGKPAPLTPHVRRQMARIVHEALVNVRKHSGANRVLVRANVEGDSWHVSIEDDGRGFPFGGRLTQDELEAQHHGPRTIGERARIIGGALTVESKPGAGSRVEVAVPLTASP